MSDEHCSYKVNRAWTKEEILDELKSLKERFESGEVKVAALRVYEKDGAFRDVVLGAETEEERQQALAELHRGITRGLH